MRRLGAIPVKTSAVAVILLAGAVYVAADVRQAVWHKKAVSIQQSALSQPPSTPLHDQKTPDQKTQGQKTSRELSDEVAAEREMARKRAQAPAPGDGHTRQIVISIADRQLALLEDGQVVKTYPIAVGARVSPSPDGDFVIINRAKDPAYNNKGTIVEPGKNNPLGSRWMGLSARGYGIHGTNAPSSIGKAASHGCFRMRKQDVEDLYSRVKVGDTVVIRRQRDAMIASVFPHDAPPATSPAAEVQVASATTTVATTTATDTTER
jgi:lipoprotein-anchoring transpeptidase ErfK/SrfK